MFHYNILFLLGFFSGVFIYQHCPCVRNFLDRNVPKTSDEQKLNFLNWNLEI